MAENYRDSVVTNYEELVDEEENSLKNELQNLFSEYTEISKINMGFPDSWEKLKILG